MSREMVEMARAMMGGRVAATKKDFERAERLIAAGYRKFEIVDEPPGAPKWPKTGGPLNGAQAYWNDPETHGLTIRDYFAAAALQGIMANEAAVQRYATQAQAEGFEPITLMTTMAYYTADTMLQERAK